MKVPVNDPSINNVPVVCVCVCVQRKITLLTRPTLPVASPAPNTSPGSPGGVGSIMTGADSSALIRYTDPGCVCV